MKTNKRLTSILITASMLATTTGAVRLVSFAETQTTRITSELSTEDLTIATPSEVDIIENKITTYGSSDVDSSQSETEMGGDFERPTNPAEPEEIVIDIKNTFNDANDVIVRGTKIWNDNNDAAGFRPEQIIVNLLADGIEIKEITIDAADNWEYEFNNLPKYKDGKEIVYTVEEDAVAMYDTTYIEK